MRRRRPAAIVRRVKSLRLPIIGLCAALSLSGCATRYTKFHVTDYRGKVLAEWIAEGPTQRVRNGYRIKAVQRTSAPPHSQTMTYPNGWKTTVVGPHIIHRPCGKPFWLYQLDGH